jgi:hypothetical protein
LKKLFFGLWGGRSASWCGRYVGLGMVVGDLP